MASIGIQVRRLRFGFIKARDILGVPDIDSPDQLRDWTWKSLELIDAFLP